MKQAREPPRRPRRFPAEVVSYVVRLIFLLPLILQIGEEMFAVPEIGDLITNRPNFWTGARKLK